MERLRRRPEIEAVSLSQNSYPYNGSNSGAEVSYDTLRSPGWTIRRLVTPDFPRVFRYRGTRGETPEQLAEMLERGEFMASDNLYRKYDCRMTDLVGQRFYLLVILRRPTDWVLHCKMYAITIMTRREAHIP